ncbi:AAA family ATPase [Butyrivibrio sp. VCB2006]|uniref:AAA family ATPase n=1 Tax=Butyrivibrio sp. VCB2006 TaxID=1280679 RepID=UPI000404E408|nr:MoxR family ATPase [Butyrivibrio sp. VCB2006]
MEQTNQKIIDLTQNMKKRLIGKDDVIQKVITCLLAGGHVLLEDVPGVGKTSLAKALADSISVSFARIQCTPDTTPADITGLSIYSPAKESFQVMPGPALNNIVLADELNRTSPKTQSALLEVMEEHRVTIDGQEFAVPEPFMVIGTQNPSEMAGTYPLPESQLDRFMVKLSIGYPDTSAAQDMAKRFLEGDLHDKTTPVLTGEDVIFMQKEVQNVTIHENLRSYAVNIVEATRAKAEISCGASPRALLSMLRCAQAIAYINGRNYCVPEDIAGAAAMTIPHRLVLTTEARLSRVTKEDMVKKILEQVKVP